MHFARIALAAVSMAATVLALSACTHDYDVFKPRADAGRDGSSNESALDDDVDVEPEPLRDEGP